jgi:hypothetical protein
LIGCKWDVAWLSEEEKAGTNTVGPYRRRLGETRLLLSVLTPGPRHPFGLSTSIGPPLLLPVLAGTPSTCMRLLLPVPAAERQRPGHPVVLLQSGSGGVLRTTSARPRSPLSTRLVLDVRCCRARDAHHLFTEIPRRANLTEVILCKPNKTTKHT